MKIPSYMRRPIKMLRHERYNSHTTRHTVYLLECGHEQRTSSLSPKKVRCWACANGQVSDSQRAAASSEETLESLVADAALAIGKLLTYAGVIEAKKAKTCAENALEDLRILQALYHPLAGTKI